MQKVMHENTIHKSDEPASLGFHDFQQDKTRSAFAKYQDLFIGSPSLSNLLKYEMLTFWLMNCPGMLGFFLRQKLYKLLFRKQGKGVAIATGVSLRQPGKISLENGCVIDELARLSVHGSETASIHLGKSVFVGHGTALIVRNGIIEIGGFTSIGSNCRIATRSHMRIGEYVLIAAYCYIGGGNHRSDRTDIPMALQGSETPRGVFIGDDVWIGGHTMVADGVNIGKGSIIGAGSFVNKDIPAYSIAFGSPARVHRKRFNADASG